MKAYQYTVMDRTGTQKKGILWAESTDETALRLKMEGYRIYSIRENSGTQHKKWTYKAVSELTYQLGLLTESGISLRRALELLSKGKSGLPYRPLFEAVQRGQTLSQAMRNEGFPDVALALLESGETSGTLGESLRYISGYYEQERQWRQKIVGALSYPAFLLLLMNVFFLVAVLFILPSFEKVFATMHIELPRMTAWLFALGGILRDHPVSVLTVHIIFVLTGIFCWRQYALRRLIHHKLWCLAQNTVWLTCVYYTSVLKVWALLLASGISIIDAVHITTPVWRNIYGREQSGKLKELLCQGHPFYESLRTCHIGNEFIWQMISVGEESGELVAMLNHCSHYYEALMAQYIARMERLLEPVLLSCMGIGVGILVISVIYPLFTSVSSLSAQ